MVVTHHIYEKQTEFAVDLAELDHWRDGHNDWHGKDDRATAIRAAQWGVWTTQIRFIIASAGGGAFLGGIGSYVLHLFGVGWPF